MVLRLALTRDLIGCHWSNSWVLRWIDILRALLELAKMFGTIDKRLEEVTPHWSCVCKARFLYIYFSIEFNHP